MTLVDWTIRALDRLVVSAHILFVVNVLISIDSKTDNRDFSMPNMYQIPNPVNRPPPVINPENFWMQNQLGNDQMMHDDNRQPDSQFSGPPPPFHSPNNRGNFQTSPNFRGNHRGNMPPRMPYSPNFRAGMRGGMNNRGRGGVGLIRGGFMNIRSRGGPW